MTNRDIESTNEPRASARADSVVRPGAPPGARAQWRARIQHNSFHGHALIRDSGDESDCR